MVRAETALVIPHADLNIGTLGGEAISSVQETKSKMKLKRSLEKKRTHTHAHTYTLRMRIKSRYLKRHDVHEETAVTLKTSEAAAAVTAVTAAVTQKLHAVNASDDDL